MTDPGAGAAPRGNNVGGGPGETLFAVIVCIVAMFLPIVLIEKGYEDFVASHGAVREGAAGTTLALAVVVRTVLRNFIRTSTRAGLRMGVKSSMGGILRVATRNLFASITRSAVGGRGSKGPAAPAVDSEQAADPARTATPAAERRPGNLRSLLLGSALLYISWVIVIGLGQPFADLMTAEQAARAAALESEALARVRASSRQPDILAWELDEQRDALRDAVIGKRLELKMTRDAQARDRIVDELSQLTADLTVAQSELSDALMRSGGRLTRPDDAVQDSRRSEAQKLQRWLFTHAPYTGRIPWDSPVLWAAAALFVLPLWVIYFIQAGAARRLGVPLRHETGLDGGLIQLYFAGAFSFMPLSSDVVVEGTARERGRVSLAGILTPTAISVLLWLLWKLGGETLSPLLLASDAFLIYPMVQCFPLDPLDGSRLFRWHRGIWLAVFLLVMATFIFMGSEGLKHVI